MDFYTVFFIYLYRVYFWNAYGTSILAMRLEDKLFAPALIVSLIHGKAAATWYFASLIQYVFVAPDPLKDQELPRTPQQGPLEGL